jgi:hypothetical protein
MRNLLIVRVIGLGALCLAMEKATAQVRGKWESQECTQLSDLKAMPPAGPIKLNAT